MCIVYWKHIDKNESCTYEIFQKIEFNLEVLIAKYV